MTTSADHPAPGTERLPSAPATPTNAALELARTRLRSVVNGTSEPRNFRDDVRAALDELDRAHARHAAARTVLANHRGGSDTLDMILDEALAALDGQADQ